MPHAPQRLYLALNRERVLICRDRWEKTLIFDIKIRKAIQRLFSWRWLDRPPKLWQLYVRATSVTLVMSMSSYPVRWSRPFSENSHWPVFKRSYWQCHAAEFNERKFILSTLSTNSILESPCFSLSDYEHRMGKWLMGVREQVIILVLMPSTLWIVHSSTQWTLEYFWIFMNSESLGNRCLCIFF